MIIGRHKGEIVPDPCEASEVRWIDFNALSDELIAEPTKFAAWVPMVLSMTMASTL